MFLYVRPAGVHAPYAPYAPAPEANGREEPLAAAVRCLEAISDPTLLRIVGALVERESASRPELAGAAFASVGTVRKRLVGLIAAGIVEAHPCRGTGVGRPRVHYRLTAEVRRSLTRVAGLAGRASATR
jgi:predicted ArsR family transcriptional regulator